MWLPPALIPSRLAPDPWRRHLAARLACSLATAAVLAGAPEVVSLAAGWVDAHCLLRAATGWPCPGCGITTSLMALGSGDVGRAIRSNPAGLAVAAALAVQAGVAARGVWLAAGEARGGAWLRHQDRLLLAALAAAWAARLWDRL
jgi:hypothetical protein